MHIYRQKMEEEAAIKKALAGEKFSTLPNTLDGTIRGMKVILAMGYTDRKAFELVAQMVQEQRIEETK